MKAKFKLIIFIILSMLVIFTNLSMERNYKLKTIDSRAIVTPVTHTEQEKRDYKNELIAKNQEHDYDYIINYLNNNGDLERAKKLAEMVQDVKDGKIPYSKYISEINEDGRYDSVIDFIEDKKPISEAKKLVREIDSGKYGSENTGMPYKDFLSLINNDGEYDYVIKFLENGGDEYEARRMVNNIKHGKTAEPVFKD